MWIRLRAVPMTFTAASTPAVHVGPRNVSGSPGSSRETRGRTAPMTALATSAELTHSPYAHLPATPAAPRRPAGHRPATPAAPRRPTGHRPATPAAPCRPTGHRPATPAAPRRPTGRQRYGCIHIGR